MTYSDEGPAPSPAPRRLALPLAQPKVVFGLLAINIVVWLAMMLAGGSTNAAVLIRFGAKANVLIAQGQVWRLFTSMFLHIGVMHLFFNSYALFIFGAEVERLYGSPRFVVIYLLAGLWGSLFSFAFGPNLSAGASGAIFGLLGTMVAYFRRHRETFGAWGRQRLLSLLSVAGLNLVLGFTVPGIDNLAHLGGLLSGAALGLTLAPDYQVRWEGTGGQPTVVDRSSLGTRWPVLALTVVLLVAGVAGAMTVQRGSPSTLIWRGQLALDGKDAATAESLFRQAIERDPHSTQAYFFLGVALSEQNEMAEAALAYEGALRLDPNLAEAHWNLALTYAVLDRPADAVSQLEAFITLTPDSVEADRARAMITLLQESAP